MYSFGEKFVNYHVSDNDTSEINSPTIPKWNWTWDRTLKTIILSPIVIFTIVGNFFVVYTFVKRRRVKKLVIKMICAGEI